MASRKGRPNVLSATAKENIIAVFTRLGGTAAMARWAKRHQTEFYKLYARLVPVDLNHGGSVGIYGRLEVPVEQRDPLEGTERPAVGGDTQARH